ncbi:FAD-binding domain-containing protein [Exidia glandulosa HHB12029]|uniref:FAD-binding domain-containing protein n=1 Tax=Exidia glandulosa HHB12029 TaxID=1314781 RepID=A0A165PY83_EXIGL|nr:FAD-binding domain-containing protein [Exidia glandulosa HHB12029]
MVFSALFHSQPHVPPSPFIADLERAGIAGEVITQANHPIDYELGTIAWNARCLFRPEAIVKVVDAHDVAKAVKVAAKHGVPVQARSGGHSFGNYASGGQNGALVIHLAKLSKVEYDAHTKRATIGGGALLGKVTTELDKHRVTFPHGTCAQVGIGGHATIGGQGVLSRLYGLSLDSLVEIEAVLADGSIVRANETHNSDLFWGVRGAGASLCIVTSFVFKTYPTPSEVTHYSFEYTIGGAKDLARVFLKWQDFIRTPEVFNDRYFNSLVTVKKGSVLIQGSRIGSRAELDKSAIHLHLGEGAKAKTYDVKVFDWVASVQKWSVDAVNDFGSSIPLPQYMKSLVVKQSEPLTEEAVTAWFEYIQEHAPKGAQTFFLADLEGGAINDVPSSATAYAHREALYTLCGYSIHPMLPFPDNVISYMSSALDVIRAHMKPRVWGVYPGYVDPLLPAHEWPEAYWGQNYKRLREVKTKYDPQDVFRNPQSVKPFSSKL